MAGVPLEAARLNAGVGSWLVNTNLLIRVSGEGPRA